LHVAHGGTWKRIATPQLSIADPQHVHPLPTVALQDKALSR